MALDGADRPLNHAEPVIGAVIAGNLAHQNHDNRRLFVQRLRCVINAGNAVPLCIKWILIPICLGPDHPIQRLPAL